MSLWFILAIGGCGGDARVEMSAAEAISRLADEFQTTTNEYHEEVRESDNRRVEDIVGSLVVRLRNSQSDDEAREHAGMFMQALAGINADRDTEVERHLVSRDNVRTLREVGEGLQRVGLASLGLSDEVSRYITGWVGQREQAAAARETEKAAARERRREQVSAVLARFGVGATPASQPGG